MGMITSWFEHYVDDSSSQQTFENRVSGLDKLSFNSLSSQLRKFLTNVLTFNTEPRVWQKHDRDGNLSWRVYDPCTNQYATFTSADEVRSWIEERYYH